jgi:Immunity protein 8
MIVPDIRYFLSPDIEDLEQYVPADPGNFGFALLLMVGPQGDKGEEQFQLHVVTPEWLERRYRADGPVVGRNMLIAFEYDWPRIERYLRRQVAGCTGESWTEVATKIGRFALWEFDDWQP